MNGSNDHTVAQKLAAFATSIAAEPQRVSVETREQASQRLLDNLGCILFGVRIAPARKIADLVADLGQGNCHVIARGSRTSGTAAAFAHGTLAQSFEMNDLGVYTHPGACIIPSCLAALDQTSRKVSGAEFLVAIAVGYDITIRLSESVGPSAELDVGWHTPGFHGAVGAAGAASMLLGLDAGATAQAIVMAADIAGGGLMMARLGSDMKRVHCGRAAETGLLCALFAQRGLSSRLDTFEHPDWGYCRTMTASTDRFDLATIDKDIGSRFVGFSRTAVKYYPVGAEVLGMIDNINRLKAQGLDTGKIARITVRTPSFFVKAAGHAFPDHISHIHFNSEYGIAMALTHDIRPVYEGGAVIAQWIAGYRNPAVRALADRVQHVADDELERRNPYSVDSKVEIELTDGTVLRAETQYVRKAESAGTMQFAPMDRDRIVRKFKALSEGALTTDDQQAVVDNVLGMFDLPDARALWRPLEAARAEVMA